MHLEDGLEVLIEVLVGHAAQLVEDASDFDAIIGVRVSSSFGCDQEPLLVAMVEACLPDVGRVVVDISQHKASLIWQLLVFLHSMACLRAQGECEPFPEPPETVKAIARARDRRAVLNQLYPDGSFGIFPYEVEALVERAELLPRSMVAGRELGEPLPDLSG